MALFLKHQNMLYTIRLNFLKCLGFLHLFFAGLHPSFCQEYRTVSPFPYPFDIYDEEIKTVEIYKKGWEQGYPLISLGGTNEIVYCHFDDLNMDTRSLKYRVEHCTAGWEKSNLSFYDFANGLPDDYLIDYEYSSNMGLRYTHYTLELPNENLQFRISGNYKLIVFEEDEPDSALFEVGFMVASERVTIELSAHRAQDVDLRYAGQEIDFEITSDHYHITNPYQDLKTFILQNFRHGNAISLSPLFVKSNSLDFSYDQENVFQGGNEFRELDLRNLIPNRQVADVDQSNTIPVITLLPDEKRAFRNYKSLFDINGRYVKSVDEFMFNTELDAEYCWVDFTLNYPYEMGEKGVYIFGELSRWGYHDDFKLTFDPERRVYTKRVLLKQGYYNFLYQIGGPHYLPTPFSSDVWSIEGSHYETENEYLILVYHKTPGTFYDSLIGVEFVQFPERN